MRKNISENHTRLAWHSSPARPWPPPPPSFFETSALPQNRPCWLGSDRIEPATGYDLEPGTDCAEKDRHNETSAMKTPFNHCYCSSVSPVHAAVFTDPPNCMYVDISWVSTRVIILVTLSMPRICVCGRRLDSVSQCHRHLR